MLTKGDGNRVDDRGLYSIGQLWLKSEDILGRVNGTIQYLGLILLILNDWTTFTYILSGD